MQERKVLPVKILIATDNQSVVAKLTDILDSEVFGVTVTATQARATELLDRNSYDLALLDISLKDGSGYSLCMTIKRDYDIPVIFVSDHSDEHSIVTGLDIGADDYICAPFRPRELMSRIKNVLRRTGKTQAVLEHGDIRVDTVRGLVTKNGREIFLSALEYRMLLIFLSNKGKVMSRARLLEEIWDIGGDYVNDNTLTVYIKRIREKIEDTPGNPQVIKTIRGLGYKVGD